LDRAGGLDNCTLVYVRLNGLIQGRRSVAFSGRLLQLGCAQQSGGASPVTAARTAYRTRSLRHGFQKKGNGPGALCWCHLAIAVSLCDDENKRNALALLKKGGAEVRACGLQEVLCERRQQAGHIKAGGLEQVFDGFAQRFVVDDKRRSAACLDFAASCLSGE
jgi:hypothetical protein